MATIEEHATAIAMLKNNLKVLIETDIESLLTKEAGGVQIKFDQGREFIERLLGLYVVLSECPLEVVPHQTLNDLLGKVKEATTAIEQIKNFNPQSGNAIQQRDQILNRIRDLYDAHFIATTPTIAYTSRLGYDFAGLERKAKENLDAISKVEVDVTSRLTELEKRGQATLTVMQKAAAEMGVSQQAIYFRDQAKYHDDEAKKWLKYTIWMAVITVVFALGNLVYYWFADPTFTTARLIQVTVSKLFVLSVLYYGIVWAAKNYRSHIHNYVVNTHRQNSLSTFQAFVTGSSDEATKNAVLIRSTEAVFSPVNSGYASSDNEASGSPQILEIIRSAVDTAKK